MGKLCGGKARLIDGSPWSVPTMLSTWWVHGTSESGVMGLPSGRVHQHLVRCKGALGQAREKLVLGIYASGGELRTTSPSWILTFFGLLQA